MSLTINSLQSTLTVYTRRAILHKCYISGKIQAHFLFLFERTIGNLSNSILRFNSVWFVRKIYLNPCRLLFIFDIGNRHRH